MLRRFVVFVFFIGLAGPASADWFFRGTPNDWGKTALSQGGTTDTYGTCQTFSGKPNPRFKIDRFGDWKESYPAADYTLADGSYQISFDAKTPGIINVAPVKNCGEGHDAWYFRGTPNNWGTTKMSPVGNGDIFCTEVEFTRQDPNPRFKIDHFGDWKENYPAQDKLVSPDCARYAICYDRASKSIIQVNKVADITTGACGSSVGPKPSLGVTYKPEATTFALWSPDTANVQLSLDNKQYPMARVPDADGLTDVYAATVAGDHHLKRYNFRVDGREARDPYGRMVEPGTNNNIVVDLAQTEPKDGWAKEGWASRPFLKEREDAIIYEVNVRDFTMDTSSGVAPEKRGKFLGMVQSETQFQGQATGLKHLKELGVTHVQILPFYDFNACLNAPSCYSWGYDPVNYNVPEERYSVSSDPLDRIRELKQTINEFHKAGIRVVMDVVYNHTPNKSVFGPITDKYYLSNDISGAGATINVHQQPMVSRFIRDSLEYWVREYHIDGFRFDLMGIFDYAVVGDWGRYLNNQFPDSNLLIYGEPWMCCGKDPVPEKERLRLGSVGAIDDAHVGAFNDQYRKALKGEGDNGTGGGFLFNQAGDLSSVRVGSRGAIRFAHSKGQTLPNPWDQMFTNDPEQTINYVSAHDNLILRDKILAWAKLNGASNNASYLKRIQEFAGGILLTSQGIPFFHAGDEMLRDKQGDGNSYQSPDSVNAIRWNLKADNADVVEYYKQVIALRKNHPGFRMTSWDQINQYVDTNEKLRNGVVVNTINAQANGDGWQKIIVIYNSANDYEYTLPPGTWHVAMEKSDPKAGNDRPVSGKVVAEGTAVTVLHQ
jgi:pullulanase